MKLPFPVLPWAVRLSWASLPFMVGIPFGAALGEHSRPVSLVGVVLAWGIWGTGLLATLVAHPLGCTALRVFSPGVLAAALWAGFNADGRTAWRIAGVVQVSVLSNDTQGPRIGLFRYLCYL